MKHFAKSLKLFFILMILLLVTGCQINSVSIVKLHYVSEYGTVPEDKEIVPGYALKEEDLSAPVLVGTKLALFGYGEMRERTFKSNSYVPLGEGLGEIPELANITECYIDDGIATIGKGAFYGAEKLTKITGCRDVYKFDDGSLEEQSNPALTDFYYDGDESDWEYVEFANTSAKTWLSSKIHYTESQNQERIYE